MSRVLAYTTPALGHLYPMVPLLLELRERGHDVHVRTLPDQVEMLGHIGLSASGIDPRILEVPITDYAARGAKAALASAAEVFSARGEIDAQDLSAAIGEVDPDLLIVDTNAWGALFTAEAWGGPWAMFSPYTPAISSPGTPPFGPGLAPMGGPVGRVRDALVRRLIIGAVESSMLPKVNVLRSRLGLGPVVSADAFLRSAPLMIVTTAAPFEYPSTDWGERIITIGACAWEPPAEPPGWLDDLDRPVVLVTTSSEFQDDGVLVRTALLALADEPVHVVATMPAGLAEGLDIPANAVVAQFVPHGPVLDRACVAVTHGGMGVTQKALARGIPLCVVPFGRDQLEVARRVEVSGSGTRLPARRLNPARLRAAVREARTCTAGASAVAAGYAASGGAARGAEALESLL